jgi:hypothetical protein
LGEEITKNIYKFVMKKSIIIMILGWLAITVQSQNLLPQSCYLRLEGMNQGKKEIVHLVKVNDSLYGDYNATEMYGKMNAKGSFWLKEWPGDKGISIKGQYTDNQHIPVTLTNENIKGKKIAFNMYVRYPEGSLQLKVYHENAVRKITKDPKSPSATVKLTMLVPDGSGIQPNVADSVNRIMQNAFKETAEFQVKNGSPDALLTNIKNDFLDNYSKSNEELYKEMPGASYEWVLLKCTHIIYNDEHKLSFYNSSYTFTGGAHGQGTQEFTSVNLKTGNTITMNDLFKPGYETQLTRLLTNKLQQNLKLPAGGKLNDAGYFVDEVKPNDNFYVNGQGIGFYYNQYDIAPYSSGPTDIFLTREELKGLLK